MVFSRSSLLALVVAGGLFAAGCGGGSDAAVTFVDTETQPTQTETQPATTPTATMPTTTTAPTTTITTPTTTATTPTTTPGDTGGATVPEGDGSSSSGTGGTTVPSDTGPSSSTTTTPQDPDCKPGTGPGHPDRPQCEPASGPDARPDENP